MSRSRPSFHFAPQRRFSKCFSHRSVTDHYGKQIGHCLVTIAHMEEVDQTNGRVGMASATFHLVEAPEITVKIVEPTQSNKA